MSRWWIPLILVAMVGCATTYSRGRKLAEQGRFEDASRYWMRVLDQDLDAKGPRRGLNEYGPSAVWVHMETAQEHEAERRYEAAITSYAAALSIADELASYDIDPGLDREELGHLITEVEDALAAYLYEQGAAAEGRNEYATAIEWWERARALRRDYTDTAERIGAAYRAAGHAAVRSKDYEESIAAFAQAITWTEDLDARSWHDAVSVALASHYLSVGACRSAYELLDAVRNTAIHPGLGEDIARAEDCARVEIVVFPFEHTPGAGPSELDAAGIVSDAVTQNLRDLASPYVRLVDPSLADSVPNVFGKRFEVRGRLSQLVVERPDPTDEALTVSGTHKVDCPSPDGYATYNPELCDEAVTLTYDLHVESASLGLIGSVRVSDPRTGELMMTRSFDARVTRESRQRSALRTDAGEVIAGPTADVDVFAVEEDVLSIPTEREPLPRDSELMDASSQQLAKSAAAAILETVDIEPEPTPPRHLDIRPPTTDASQIEFSDPGPRDDGTPTRAVIRGGPP